MKLNVQSFAKFGIIFLLLIAVRIQALNNGVYAYAQSDANPSASDLVLIIDASGSMWGQIEGENKIVIARKVLKDLINELPADANVGLIAYGHRDKGDCEDIETIVSPGPLDKTVLIEKIEALNPKGKTPITDSVNQAFEVVRPSENAATIILVSDGIETCGGDPCKAVKDAKGSGIKFVMHVVGFDVAKEDVSQLECAAQAGEGLYLSAANAGELSAALNTAVEIPADLPTGKLSVQVTAEGKLKDAYINVANTKTGENIQGGRTYTSPNTNPRIIPLPDGTYDIEIGPIGLKGVNNQIIKGIEIKEGMTVEKVVDFSFGELAIGVKRNGLLSDATVNVYKAGTNKNVASGRTYKSSNTNPDKFKLSPGTYDIVVKSVEIADKPSERFTGVEIKPGETLEKSVEFLSGNLKISAVAGDNLADAVVRVNESEAGAQVAQGRTYTSPNSNPKEFVLTPGSYKVTIKAVKLEGKPSKEAEVEIIEGETVEHNADFSE